MNNTKNILSLVYAGNLSVEDAYDEIMKSMSLDLDCANIDLHRKHRKGSPEVIFGQGKSASQIATIIGGMYDNGEDNILVTRIGRDKFDEVKSILGKSECWMDIPTTYDEEAKVAVTGSIKPADGKGTIAVVTAGTSDIPVAKEAAITARYLGNEVVQITDVGVAGIHRLMAKMDVISNARVVIAVAGMEGALASVIGGLVSAPVIAVPTSVGYGASFNGLAALLSMLNSCASGVSVVNIDNGFGAAYQASIINHL